MFVLPMNSESEWKKKLFVTLILALVSDELVERKMIP